MCDVVLGREAIGRLGELIGVKGVWNEEQTGYRWTLRGAVQRVWSAPAMGADGQLTWRLQLRTFVLEGFTGSASQCAALSAVMPPVTFAGLVRRTDHPTRLELATSLDARGDVRTLAVAAHVQAAEAKLLGRLRGLSAIGLTPLDSQPTDAPPVHLTDEPLIRACCTGEEHAHAVPFLDEAVDFLRLRTAARVVPMPWGISASFPVGRRAETQCGLEMRTNADDPLLGRALAFTLTTPVRGALVDALAWNQFEVRPSSQADALGGWSVTSAGFLVHRFVYPRALLNDGDPLQILLAYARRADDVADFIVGRR